MKPINIEVFDAKSNTTITAILNEVQTFTELPTVAPDWLSGRDGG